MITRQIGDPRAEGNALGNMGNAYVALGQVEKAITSYEQCLVIVRQIGDRRAEGHFLGNLGSAYLQLKHVEKARACWQQALRIGEEIKNPAIVQFCSQQLQLHRG